MASEGKFRAGQAAGSAGVGGSLRDGASNLSRANKCPISSTWGFGKDGTKQDACRSRKNIEADAELECILCT